MFGHRGRHLDAPPRRRSTGRRIFPLVMALVLATASVALADNTEVDGDTTVIHQSSVEGLDLGTICVGASAASPNDPSGVGILARKAGGGNAWTNGAVLTAAYEGADVTSDPGGASVSATLPPSPGDTIQLPHNWEGVSNNTFAGPVRVIVEVQAGATAGPFGATLTFSLNGNDGLSRSGQLSVTAVISDSGECAVAQNVPPTADAGGPYTGQEGTAVALDGSGSTDSDGTIESYLWTADPQDGGTDDPDAGASCSIDDAAAESPQVTCTDDGVFDITLTVTDDEGESDTATTTLTLDNVGPAITSASVDVEGGVYKVNTPVQLSVAFTDAGTNDTHDCEVDWDDGNTSQDEGIESSGDGTCGFSHQYAEAGLYNVDVAVEDDDGGTDSTTIWVVVYDPEAGFVTGGGWIDSPAGAYTADETLAGKATFGFVAKYKKGANVPDGNTEFQFKAGGLNFKSTSYEWLVVAGQKAQFKGEGTVNGESGYGFMLSAVDGAPDTFRIKITGPGGLVYDNQMGAADDAAASTELGGGSIVVHTPNGKNK